MRLVSRRAVQPGTARPIASGRRSREDGAWPPGDAAWQASLRREPGLARERLARLGEEALRPLAPDVFHWSLYGLKTSHRASIPPAFRRALGVRHPDGEVSFRLRLPAGLASDLECAMRHARGRLVRAVNAMRGAGPDDDGPAGLRLALRFRALGRPLPRWVGLLALLEEFIAVWDDPEGLPKRPGDPVYARDGWRCTAPGCTSRRHLEDHHVVYRSRGGDDAPSNRTCLCRFHHQRGEHGDLASCRGQAPLHLTWRQGRRELATRFRNERRLAPAGGEPR